MFKSVLIIIFVIIMLFVIRTILQRLKQTDSKVKPLNNLDTVQCLHCETYIPRSDAVMQGNKSFCSTKHLNDWNHSR